MKTIYAPVTAATLLLALGGCNQKSEKSVDNVVNVTEETATDLGNAASNALSAAVDAVTPTPTGQEFADKAARSDAFEIAAAKLALDNAASPKVKSFAHEMIAAHTASTEKIKAAAKRATAAITPDATLTDSEKTRLEDLGKLKGADFDTSYLAGQVDAHKAALALMKDYAKHGDVASLKDAATAIVPIVQKHLDKAKELKG